MNINYDVCLLLMLMYIHSKLGTNFTSSHTRLSTTRRQQTLTHEAENGKQSLLIRDGMRNIKSLF